MVSMYTGSALMHLFVHGGLCVCSQACLLECVLLRGGGEAMYR